MQSNVWSKLFGGDLECGECVIFDCRVFVQFHLISVAAIYLQYWSNTDRILAPHKTNIVYWRVYVGYSYHGAGRVGASVPPSAPPYSPWPIDLVDYVSRSRRPLCGHGRRYQRADHADSLIYVDHRPSTSWRVEPRPDVDGRGTSEERRRPRCHHPAAAIADSRSTQHTFIE